MAISTEGIEVDIKFVSLRPGEGWTIEIDLDMRARNYEKNQAMRKAEELGIAGKVVNGHEDNFGLVVDRINTEVTNLKNSWVDFINDWNSGVYDE